MKNHLPSFFPSSKKVMGKIIRKIIGKNMENRFTTTPRRASAVFLIKSDRNTCCFVALLLK
jgi:hypothetical protein